MTIYQPLAALGLLPLTGIAWPGMGLDSPSDAIVHLAVLLWIALPATPGRALRRPAIDAHDLAIRATPRWQHARLATGLAAALAATTGVALVARSAGFAAGRGRGAGPAAPAIERALGYARGLACPAPVGAVDVVVPADLLGVPRDADTARFHREVRARVRGAAATGRAIAAGLTAGGACTGRAGGWQLSPVGADACELALDLGWPTLRVTVTRDAAIARCEVTVDDDVLAPLRPRPAPPPRVRVVGATVGAAALDRAEIIGAGVAVRLRPGAGVLDLGDGDRLGLRAADRAARARRHDRRGRRRRGPAARRGRRGAGLASARGALAPGRRRPAAHAHRRDRRGRGRRRRRGARGWSGDRTSWAGGCRRCSPTTRGATRRYVHGSALPELGWRNPYDVNHSLGLDGWIHAAVAQGGATSRPATSPACGTLAPPPPTEPVCTASPSDGVLECRVALDPELALTLRALTELIALDPAGTTGQGTPPTRAAMVLLRGDTGELLAEGDFVPGRASSAYAPATPALARALAALREARGEASAEKFDLHRPIAIGSTLKPLVARAAEQVAPALTRAFTLDGVGVAAATCRRRDRMLTRLLGHCPATELVGRLERTGWLDLHDYLARSSNTYQAALGVLALAWPDGRYQLDDAALGLDEVLATDVTVWPRPLDVIHDDRRVLGARGVRLGPLRDTPLWSRFEALIGRRLCTLGSKALCVQLGDRRDLCATRALPVASPSADLRHLVALGPATFDLYPPGHDGDARTVPVTEYLQFLRGSGVHPVGSLAQLTDGFNRLIYDPTEDGPYRLAASWFPVPVAGRVPAEACTAIGGHAPVVRGDDGGLCGAVRGGGTAARVMRPLLDDPRVRLYGAKTGTIDTLADVGERRARCEAWNRAHTLAGLPAHAAAQPYWLTCGTAVPDDSLFVVAFSVETASGPVPLTLGVHLERSGKGVAAMAARLYIQAIASLLGATP